MSALLTLIWTAPVRADRVDNINSEEISTQHIPGLALAVIRNGKVERFSGYVVSNIERRIPVMRNHSTPEFEGPG
jgi:CubicO group peptidase (beta-lactamase class C family)